MKCPDLRCDIVKYHTKNIIERYPSVEFSEHRFFGHTSAIAQAVYDLNYHDFDYNQPSSSSRCG